MVLTSDDPPRHTRLRQSLNRAFTPRRVRALEPWISGIVDELLDGVGGEHEGVDSFTTPLPVTAIATLLGIPTEERDRFKRWSNALLSGLAGVTSACDQIPAANEQPSIAFPDAPGHIHPGT